MAKTPATPMGANQENLSASGKPSGGFGEGTTILVVNPHDDSRSDNTEANAKDSPIAPPAHVGNRREFIMNSIVSAAAVASATAIPNVNDVAQAASPSAALARTEQVIAVLRSRYVRDNWMIEENDAEQALAYMRNYAAGKAEDDDHGNAVMVGFFGSHGQSLDWIFRGDVSGMICQLATQSTRAAVVADGHLLELVDQHGIETHECQQIEAKWRKLDDQRCASKTTTRGYKAAQRQLDRQSDVCNTIELKIVGTPAKTIDGIIAKARTLNRNLINGESVEEGIDAKFGAAITRDLLALGNEDPESSHSPAPIADPIFAAIEAHRAARLEYEQACEKHSRVEEKFVDKERPEARVEIGEREEFEISAHSNGRGGRIIECQPLKRMVPIYATSYLDIDKNTPPDLGEVERAEWIAQKRKQLDAEEDRISVEWQETELGKLEFLMSETFDIEDRRTRDLVWTTPTTSQGLAVLLGYCRELGGFQELTRAAEWATALEWAIENAARSLAGLPKPPMTKLIQDLWELKQREDREALLA